MTTQAQQLAYALIVVFEGEDLTSYRDGGGIWTIGLGHTKGVKEQQTITPQQSCEFFAEDSASLFTYVSTISTNIWQAAGYVSFGYNCGERALKRVHAGDAFMVDFIHDSRGRIEPGLVSRRRLESLLTHS